MAAKTYQIQYVDKSGEKHELHGVTDTKATIGPLEGAGAKDFVVLIEKHGGGTVPPNPAHKSSLEAIQKFNQVKGKTK